MITKAARNTKGQSESTGDKWRIVGDEIIKGISNSVTYTLQDIAEVPPETLPEESTIEDARRILGDMILESQLTADEVWAIAALYPAWEVGLSVVADGLYSHGTTVYKVLQAHTTQADWTPDATPALWVKAVPDDVIAEWVQPTGGHDAYNIGDKVSFENAVYESTIDANVWSPTGYPQGWNWLYDL